MKRLLANAFYRDGALAGAANLLTNAGSFVYYSAAAHALAPSTGGLFLALIAAALLVSVFANIAGVALAPDISRLHATGHRGTVRVLAERAAVAWFAISCILVCLAVVMRGAGESLFHLDDPLLLLETAAVISANAILYLTRAFVQAIARFDLLAWSGALEVVLKAIAAAAIIAAPSLRLTIGALAVVLALSAFATAWPVLAYLRSARATHILLGQRSLERSPAGSLVSAFSALSVMTFADGIIARHMLAPFDAGLYNAVALAGRALMSALGFLPLVILSKVHGKDADDGTDRKFYAVLAIGCLSAIALFTLFPGYILIAVGGRSFLSGAPLVGLYGIAASALAMTNVVVSFRISRGARYIGRALITIACLEVVTMLLYHPSAVALVQVIIIGHLLALVASCLSRTPHDLARAAMAVQSGANSAGSSTT